MTDEIVDAKPKQVLAVIRQMPTLPWPEGDEWLEWEINGLEGETGSLMHVLPLAMTADRKALAAFTDSLPSRADRLWGTRRRFDVDRADGAPAKEWDRHDTVARLVRSLGTDHALWWSFDGNAAVLIDGSTAAGSTDYRAAVVVLPVQWLGTPGAEESALRKPLVADFLSGDAGRVMHAVWEVIATREPSVLTPLAAALPAIETATAGLDLGGALASNRDHLAHAIHRIELFKDGRCLCAAYPSHQFYDPAKEEQRGHIRIGDAVPNPQQREPDRVCECLNCGRRYQVESGESHYPWWQWTQLT